MVERLAATARKLKKGGPLSSDTWLLSVVARIYAASLPHNHPPSKPSRPRTQERLKHKRKAVFRETSCNHSAIFFSKHYVWETTVLRPSDSSPIRYSAALIRFDVSNEHNFTGEKGHAAAGTEVRREIFRLVSMAKIGTTLIKTNF